MSAATVDQLAVHAVHTALLAKFTSAGESNNVTDVIAHNTRRVTPSVNNLRYLSSNVPKIVSVNGSRLVQNQIMPESIHSSHNSEYDHRKIVSKLVSNLYRNQKHDRELPLTPFEHSVAPEILPDKFVPPDGTRLVPTEKSALKLKLAKNAIDSLLVLNDPDMREMPMKVLPRVNAPSTFDVLSRCMQPINDQIDKRVWSDSACRNASRIASVPRMHLKIPEPSLSEFHSEDNSDNSFRNLKRKKNEKQLLDPFERVGSNPLISFSSLNEEEILLPGDDIKLDILKEDEWFQTLTEAQKMSISAPISYKHSAKVAAALERRLIAAQRKKHVRFNMETKNEDSGENLKSRFEVDDFNIIKDFATAPLVVASLAAKKVMSPVDIDTLERKYHAEEIDLHEVEDRQILAIGLGTEKETDPPINQTFFQKLQSIILSFFDVGETPEDNDDNHNAALSMNLREREVEPSIAPMNAAVEASLYQKSHASHGLIRSWNTRFAQEKLDFSPHPLSLMEEDAIRRMNTSVLPPLHSDQTPISLLDLASRQPAPFQMLEGESQELWERRCKKWVCRMELILKFPPSVVFQNASLWDSSDAVGNIFPAEFRRGIATALGISVDEVSILSITPGVLSDSNLQLRRYMESLAPPGAVNFDIAAEMLWEGIDGEEEKLKSIIQQEELHDGDEDYNFNKDLTHSSLYDPENDEDSNWNSDAFPQAWMNVEASRETLMAEAESFLKLDSEPDGIRVLFDVYVSAGRNKIITVDKKTGAEVKSMVRVQRLKELDRIMQTAVIVTPVDPFRELYTQTVSISSDLRSGVLKRFCTLRPRISLAGVWPPSPKDRDLERYREKIGAIESPKFRNNFGADNPGSMWVIGEDGRFFEKKTKTNEGVIFIPPLRAGQLGAVIQLGKWMIGGGDFSLGVDPVEVHNMKTKMMRQMVKIWLESSMLSRVKTEEKFKRLLAEADAALEEQKRIVQQLKQIAIDEKTNHLKNTELIRNEHLQKLSEQALRLQDVRRASMLALEAAKKDAQDDMNKLKLNLSRNAVIDKSIKDKEQNHDFVEIEAKLNMEIKEKEATIQKLQNENNLLAKKIQKAPPILPKAPPRAASKKLETEAASRYETPMRKKKHSPYSPNGLQRLERILTRDENGVEGVYNNGEFIPLEGQQLVEGPDGEKGIWLQNGSFLPVRTVNMQKLTFMVKEVHTLLEKKKINTITPIEQSRLDIIQMKLAKETDNQIPVSYDSSAYPNGGTDDDDIDEPSLHHLHGPEHYKIKFKTRNKAAMDIDQDFLMELWDKIKESNGYIPGENSSFKQNTIKVPRIAECEPLDENNFIDRFINKQLALTDRAVRRQTYLPRLEANLEDLDFGESYGGPQRHLPRGYVEVPRSYVRTMLREDILVKNKNDSPLRTIQSDPKLFDKRMKYLGASLLNEPELNAVLGTGHEIRRRVAREEMKEFRDDYLQGADIGKLYKSTIDNQDWKNSYLKGKQEVMDLNEINKHM